MLPLIKIVSKIICIVVYGVLSFGPLSLHFDSSLVIYHLVCLSKKTPINYPSSTTTQDLSNARGKCVAIRIRRISSHLVNRVGSVCVQECVLASTCNIIMCEDSIIWMKFPNDPTINKTNNNQTVRYPNIGR